MQNPVKSPARILARFRLPIAVAAAAFAQPAMAQYIGHATLPTPHTPQSYRDPDSGLIFYVERDGRGVAAIGADGQVAWVADPFVDARMEPYRLERPVIVSIGKPLEWMIRDRKGRFVSIAFNSTQFGILDIADGKFIFLGQD
ncbi:hypothetical protein [Sphingomonas sp. G-3-2-10]|uniref:hypothetical protein n=1 Tax=Sphingomonas sp. G-3-2-10 TaxID=2728838 RepID=UPI00146B6593|nr:hypothetical protein [Sphingomonas sp. G-3-2-10]NML04472.1 hypothetical protein [Sphingomonas sp. G-3-2-10]